MRQQECLASGLLSVGLKAEPLAKLQYVSCADYDSLEELEQVKGKALLSMAVYMGKTRLIDNFVIG